MHRYISKPLQKIMSKVQAIPTLKLKYFNCQKGDLHEGQVLNYVCIQKSCKQKGLICSVCKHEHNGHNVVPLKYLLSTLKHHKQNPLIESQIFQKELEQLQNLKNQFLYDLKQTVQSLAQKIEKIEEQIIEKFKQQKFALLNQIEIKMKFNELIDSTLNNTLDDQESFEKDFRVIASSIESINDNKKDAGSSHINSFIFAFNLGKIIEQYEQSYQSFSSKIKKFSQESVLTMDKLLGEQTNISMSGGLPKLEQASETSTPSKEYRFNPLFKGANLTISNNNKTADCTSAGNERFALIDGPIQKKGSVIRFRVQKLKNWVGLGLAVRDIIKSKNYQFQYNNLGHGSYLLSNNSYMWSHSFAANNIQNSEFTFAQGNIIKLEVIENELVYTNESQQNKVKKLPIALNENEWKEACFCVNLCSIGDAASIL